jgi:hypothetical protein
MASESTRLTWEEAQYLAILSLRASLQQELRGAVIVHITSTREITVTGPNLIEEHSFGFESTILKLDDMHPAKSPYPEMYCAWITAQIRQHLGPEWGDAFYAAHQRWFWDDLVSHVAAGVPSTTSLSLYL